MSDLQHKDIKRINVDIVLYYEDHKIQFHGYGKTFMLTVFDNKGDIKEVVMVTDRHFNECVLTMLNVALKPYLQQIIKE